jgi:hypothetical protein
MFCSSDLVRAKHRIFIQEALGLTLGQDVDYLTEVFCGLSESLEACATVLLEIKP